MPTPPDHLPSSAEPQRSLIVDLASIVEPVDLSGLFPRPGPVEVELGSGDGSFLARYAQSSPEHNFLGVERLLGRLRKIDRKGRRAGLGNLRLVRIEARYFIEYLLSAACLRAVHVYFPDPWPKRRHERNRLIDESFPGQVARVLEPEGRIYLRTDDLQYFTRIREVFAQYKAFAAVETPPSLASEMTDFERSFHERGIVTLRAAYQLKDSEDSTEV